MKTQKNMEMPFLSMVAEPDSVGPAGRRFCRKGKPGVHKTALIAMLVLTVFSLALPAGASRYDDHLNRVQSQINENRGQAETGRDLIRQIENEDAAFRDLAKALHELETELSDRQARIMRVYDLNVLKVKLRLSVLSTTFVVGAGSAFKARTLEAAVQNLVVYIAAEFIVNPSMSRVGEYTGTTESGQSGPQKPSYDQLIVDQMLANLARLDEARQKQLEAKTDGELLNTMKKHIDAIADSRDEIRMHFEAVMKVRDEFRQAREEVERKVEQHESEEQRLAVHFEEQQRFKEMAEHDLQQQQEAVATEEPPAVEGGEQETASVPPDAGRQSDADHPAEPSAVETPTDEPGEEAEETLVVQTEDDSEIESPDEPEDEPDDEEDLVLEDDDEEELEEEREAAARAEPEPLAPVAETDEAAEADEKETVEAPPVQAGPDLADDDPRPSERDMPGLWVSEGEDHSSDYDTGHMVVDDDGTEFIKTEDGQWVETGDRYDPITREQKEQWDREIEEAARLQGAEPTTADYVPADDPAQENGGGLLDIFSEQREADRQQQVDQAADWNQQQYDMARAAAGGDQQTRIARDITEAGGRDAQAMAEQAARQAAQQQQQTSWGRVLEDAVESGVTAGGQAFGSSLGREAGKQVANSVFGSDQPKRGRPAKTAAAPPSGQKPAAGAAGATADSAPPASGKTTATGEAPPPDDSDPDQAEGMEAVESKDDQPAPSEALPEPEPRAVTTPVKPATASQQPATPAPSTSQQPREPTPAEIDGAYRDGADWRRTVQSTPMSSDAVRAGTQERYGRYTHPELKAAFRKGYSQ